MRRLLAAAVNLFLALLLLDGCLTLVEVTLRLLLGWPGLYGVRAVLATLVPCLAGILLLAAFVAAPLARVDILSAALYPFVALGAGLTIMPFFLENLSLLDLLRADPIRVATAAPGLVIASGVAAGLQVALAVVVYRRLRPGDPSQGRLVPAAAFAGPLLAWRTSLGLLAGTMGAVALGIVPLAYLNAVTWTRAVSYGYVLTDATCLYMVRKDFDRDGRRVALVGMMHIGDRSFYQRLAEDLDTPRTVVLLEGVTDRDHRIGHATLYKKTASSLGLETQNAQFDLRGKRCHLRHADVDAAVLTERTIAFLKTSAEINNAGRFDAAVLGRLVDLLYDPANFEVIYGDLVEKRNANLLRHIDASLGSYERIVVPWGAYHLPAMEKALRARGFCLRASHPRPVLRYGTILSHVLR